MLNQESTSTRDKILTIIKREGSVSVKLLTAELEITPMAVRGHLNKLEKDRLIEVNSIKQKLGRPLQVFSLTEKGDDRFPKNYGRFSIDLLESIESLDDGETMTKVLQHREQKLIAERLDMVQAGSTPEEKIKLYFDHINDLGYMPQLHKISDKQFTLHYTNCPLKEIVSTFTLCCESEINILTHVFPDAVVTRIPHMFEPSLKCSYQFNFPDPS